MSEPDSVGQVELESARDAVLAVLALYAEQIHMEKRRPEPDAERVDRLVRESIAYAGALRELDDVDAFGLAVITQMACADLARLEP